MAITRIKTSDIGDDQVRTADILDANVTYPKLLVATAPGVEDDGAGGLRVKVDGLSIAREANGLRAKGIAIVAHNATGSTIAAGKLVYFSGANTGNPTIGLSDADAGFPGPYMAHAITLESIANGATGRVLVMGRITGIDTSGVTTVGDVLYVSATAGNFTSTAPMGVSDLVQPIGRCLVKDASTGEIMFNPQPGGIGALRSYYEQALGFGFNTSSINDLDGDGFEVVGLASRTSSPSSAGETWFQSTKKQFETNDGVQLRQMSGTLATKTVISQTVASTTSETFFNTDQQFTVPANWFTVGRRLRVRAWGRYGLDAAGSPTIRFRMNMGAVPLCDTGTQNPLTSASLNRNWAIDVEILCASDGSSGTVQVGGWALLPTTVVLPQCSASVSFNTTGSALIAVSVQFSASSATNRAQMSGLVVEGD